VDGGGWVWMTRAINSTRHQSWPLGFALAVGPGFLQQKSGILLVEIYSWGIYLQICVSEDLFR